MAIILAARRLGVARFDSGEAHGDPRQALRAALHGAFGRAPAGLADCGFGGQLSRSAPNSTIKRRTQSLSWISMRSEERRVGKGVDLVSGRRAADGDKGRDPPPTLRVSSASTRTRRA